MNLGKFWTGAAIAATVLYAGCKNEADDTEPAVVPKSYTFEGNVDAKYVGVWKSSNGTSTLEMAKDGTLEIETTTRSVAGKNTNRVPGQWLVKGDSILFRYVVGAQEPTVVKYSATLVGSNLTLTQPNGRVKTLYKRS